MNRMIYDFYGSEYKNVQSFIEFHLVFEALME